MLMKLRRLLRRRPLHPWLIVRAEYVAMNPTRHDPLEFS